MELVATENAGALGSLLHPLLRQHFRPNEDTFMRPFLFVVALCFGPAAGSAQGRMDPRAPRPAHERLTVFEGTWREIGSAEATASTETCSWLEGGRRHMICVPRRQTPAGPVEQRTIYSYRGRDSTYLVTALLANGQVWTYLGRPVGNQWIFDFQSDRPSNTQRLRMVLTVAPDTIRFVEESSESNGPWRTTEDYRHVRVRAR